MHDAHEAQHNIHGVELVAMLQSALARRADEMLVGRPSNTVLYAKMKSFSRWIALVCVHANSQSEQNRTFWCYGRRYERTTLRTHVAISGIALRMRSLVVAIEKSMVFGVVLIGCCEFNCMGSMGEGEGVVC